MKTPYTETQITEFLEHAQDVGIGRARRDLGYPDSPSTAGRWAKLRGVEVNIDAVKQKAAEFNHFYRDTEKLIVCQEGLERISEQLVENLLTPDDIKKLADAVKRFIETMALIEGKPTNIVGSVAEDTTFTELLEQFMIVQRKRLSLEKTQI